MKFGTPPAPFSPWYERLSRDPVFQVNGRSVYDPSTRYYWGASNGGIQGTTFLALSPDIPRGVLNVPGAEWSLMIWRSSDFSDAFFVFDASYPDKLDQQILIALSQSVTPVYGLSSQPGPLSGIVYTQWDVRPAPLLSSSDVPPQDNAAHEACRRLPQSIQQSIDFLQPAGQIVQTCSGPCQFPPGTGS
ncbi:MAG: hypothetical protein ACYDCL_16990 [Myxococcales bacterium]